MSAVITCPYCAARRAAPPGLRTGDKHVCGSCGESFAVSESLPEAAISPDPPAFLQPPRPASSPKPVAANRRVGLIVLGGMLLMATIGGVFALNTVDQRRAHDRAIPRKIRRPWLDNTVPVDPAEPTPPDKLAALGYLPANTAVVAGIHADELLSSTAGKAFRARELALGKASFSLDAVRSWTGIDADDIDHLVVGMTLGGADLTPPIHVIVRTKKPYDAKRVLPALKATSSVRGKTPEGGTRTVYKAMIREVNARLWLADETTLVVGVFSDLEAIPEKPATDLRALPTALRDAISTRVVPGTPAWVAGHKEDWRQTLLPVLMATMKDLPGASRIGDVTTFAVWFVPSQPAKVAAAFKARDEATAKKIEDEDVAPKARERGEDVKYAREKEWVNVQVTIGR